MVWLALRNAAICCRLSFSASCTLVVNPQHATLLQAHLVLESPSPLRVISYWTRLRLDSLLGQEDNPSGFISHRPKETSTRNFLHTLLAPSSAWTLAHMNTA